MLFRSRSSTLTAGACACCPSYLHLSPRVYRRLQTNRTTGYVLCALGHVRLCTLPAGACACCPFYSFLRRYSFLYHLTEALSSLSFRPECFFLCHFDRSEAKWRNLLLRKTKRCFDYVLTDSAQHDNAVVFSFMSFRACREIQTFKRLLKAKP